MRKIKSYLKKTLSAGVLSAFLLGGSLSYGENLEEKISKPKISINLNYKHEDAQKGIDYYVSNSRFFQSYPYEFLWTNIPQLTYSEKKQVENIMKDIKYDNINSYQELVEKTEDLSESQKFVLLSAIGGILRDFNYENSNEKVSSQDTFFEKLQDSLESSEQNGLGVCRQISSHLEQLANDIGIKSTAVTGFGTTTGHVYVISKTEHGNSIVDYSKILTTNTKNIEKTLEAYQKYQGTMVFQHLFFEDAEFKYELITKDGRHFLDFVEYDKSSETLKNYLISENELISPKLSIDLDLETYLKSFKFNYKGFFVKVGEIEGNSSSPLDKMDLIQLGLGGKFSILNAYIIPDISLIKGKIYQDRKIDDDELLGVQGNLIFATNNKRLNFGSRFGMNTSFLRPSNFPIFFDYVFEVGTSYKIPVKNIDIQPYAFMQYFPFIEDIGSGDVKPTPEEITIGNIFDVKVSKNINFSLDPHYTWRIWEDEFGLAAGFGNGNIKASAKGYFTKSKYDFNPDKIGFKTELKARLKNLNLKAGYEGKRTDYDGEKEWNNSLSASVNIKY